MPTIEFGSETQFAGSYRLYAKARWADAWVLQDRAVLQSVTISAQPSVPTASFSYRYGPALERNATNWVQRNKVNIEGWFIAIEIDTPESIAEEDLSLCHHWVGYVDAVAESERGAVLYGGSLRATGLQQFSCVGIINTLAFEQMDRTFFNNNATGTEKAEVALSPPIFNRLITDRETDDDDRPEQSRAATKITEPPETETAKSFLHIFQKVYGRNNDTDTYNAWSTRDICEHLIDRYSPRDFEGEKVIKFRWKSDALAKLPDADRPTLDCSGKNLLQCLDELITASKLLGYFATYFVDTEDDDAVWIELNTYTLTETAIATGDYTVPANADVADLMLFADPATSYTTQFNLSQLYNQVLARGAKRQVVATFNIGASNSGHFTPAWSSTLSSARQTKIDAVSTSIPFADQIEKKLQIYDSPQFAAVDSAFVLRTNTWDFQISSVRLFEQEKDTEGTDQDYYPSPQHLRVLENLPLLENVNYTAGFAQTALGVRPRRFMEMQVFSPAYSITTGAPTVLTPHASNLMYWGNRHKRTYYWTATEPPFSIESKPLKNAIGVALKVNGASQYQLTSGSGSTVNSALVPHLPQITHAQLRVTLALEEDRQLEQRWPATVTALDAVRRLYIDAPNCQKTRILGGTLLWTDNQVYSVPSTTTIRDDTTKLLSIAKRAAAWFAEPRKILRLRTLRTTSQIKLGTLVEKIEPTTVQEQTINTVVTQMAFSFSDRSPPSMEIETQSGQLDPLAFLPPSWQST